MVSQLWNDWLATDLMEVTSIQLELVKQSNSQENHYWCSSTLNTLCGFQVYIHPLKKTIN